LNGDDPHGDAGIRLLEAVDEPLPRRGVLLRAEQRDGERVVAAPWDVASRESRPGNRCSHRSESGQSYDCPAT